MRALLVMCCALVVGCTHARRTEPGPSERAEDGQEQKDDRTDDGRDGAKGDAEARKDGQARPGGSPSASKEPKAKQDDARPPAEPGRPSLASSPAGLMIPDGPRQIQKALRDKGYDVPDTGELDDATSGALRKFQGERDLAQTGAPDHKTLRALGLDPDRLYAGGRD